MRSRDGAWGAAKRKRRGVNGRAASATASPCTAVIYDIGSEWSFPRFVRYPVKSYVSTLSFVPNQLPPQSTRRSV